MLFSCGFSYAVYGLLFPKWKTPNSETVSLLISTFTEQCFVPRLTACLCPTQMLLMICHCFSTVLSSCLIAFGFCPFFCLYFTHLLNNLHSLLTDSLSISKSWGAAISICYFSILDCPALSIYSPTILLYCGLPNALPSACLILPCQIYACNIVSRCRLFSTLLSISTCLVPLSWTAD